MSLVVAALLWAAVGADEYVGASMPQYGLLGGADYLLPGGSEDYHASVPAAPHAAPDYKYHEDTSGNADIPTNDIDTETWKKPSRKQRDGSRRQRSEVGVEAESMGEPLGKVKGSRRRGRARALDEGTRVGHRARARSLDAEASPPLIDYEEKPTYRKNKMMEDDDRFPRRETTERIIRRKPRDRYVRPMKSDELDFEEELETDKKLKEVVPNEYPNLGRREWNRDMPRVTRPRGGGALDLVPLPPELDEAQSEGGGRGRGVAPVDKRGPEVSLLGIDDDDDLNERLRGEATPVPHSVTEEQRPTRARNRNYDYGDNYYDMKRVMNIKNKLPSLMRRPTTRARGAPSSPKAIPPARSPQPGGVPAHTEAPPWLEQPARSSTGGGGSGGAGASELFELLYPARRAGAPPTSVSTPAAPTLTPRSTSLAPPPTPTSTTPASTPTRVAVEHSSELTLLERSRLSILKKAQKKEGWGAREATHKPPVLLQVTSKVPTVVMVEPPTSAGPWMRARPVAAHSPRQLEKVKRLMRRKLIANARSIQDLTDNWDDLVCDYIDTSLLDENESAPATRATLSFLVAHVALLVSLLC